jgi:outer membrane receptor protein involved in Fe transport
MSRNWFALTALTLGAISAASAQKPASDSAAKATPLAAVTVTATRNPRSTFDTPQPTTVIDSTVLREKLPNSIADVFRDYAGLDASGVGPNQRRPEIRLQRGQRILLLEDGLRLNNARRQQDFGELPSLASDVQRVEVVRGPSSVLYGTDALGGVVNLITGGVPRGIANGDVHGFFNVRYGTSGSLVNPDGALSARYGKLGVRLNGNYREAQPYDAPGGSFGDITLPRTTQVFDTGIRDGAYRASLGYDLTPTSDVYVRGEQYVAKNAGFGWLDPAYSGGTKVQIVYPDQQYTRFTAGYHAGALSNLFVNRVDVSVYTQGNRRHFNTFVLSPAGPGATVDSKSYNFTNLGTVGGRVELAKAIGVHTFTYGVDAFRDRSDNQDSSRTILTGFGPTPIVRTSTTPSVPNAFFTSAGAFAQLELNPLDRFTAVLGTRVQDVTAETRETPGITRPLVSVNDRTAVWTVNTLYRVTPDVNFVATLGRGFRAPNLVERFFSGAAAEGNGVQSPNPDLVAETSLNTDIGLRFARGVVYAEGFVFRNDIHDAIKAVPTGNTINGRPEYQPRNIDRLRVDGMELMTGARFLDGFDASANFTRLLGKNVSDPGNPIGDSYSSKVVGDLSYRQPAGRFTAGYTARFQGEQKDVIIGTNPIGTTIPSFVVHSARASVRLFDRAGTSNRLLFTVDNIGNRLYAEFPNASFFRPEPGRNITLALQTAF